MRLWAILVLLGAGALAGVVQPGKFSHAFGYATLYVFLPPLLFEAAWNLDARIMLRSWRPILMLAVPGVALTCAIVGGCLRFAGLPVLPALVAGAIVSATDPIAVVAIFRRLPVAATLSTIVQSEALLNDATAVVLYRALVTTALSVLSAGSIAVIVGAAIESTFVGIVFGIALAVATAYLLVGRNNALIQIVATLAGAYAAYFGADVVHASGIFAVIAFGIALRETERRSISVETAQDVARFWDAAAVFANACVFFLTGAAVQITRLAGAPLPALAAISGVVFSRFILAYALTPLAMGKNVERAWLHVVYAAGARGALSLALALAIPDSIAFRPQIIDATFCVVMATLVASALAVPRTVRVNAEDGFG